MVQANQIPNEIQNERSRTFEEKYKFKKALTFWLIFTSRNHPFSTCAKFSKKLTFLPPGTHRYMSVLWGLRNIAFSKKFS